MRLACARLEGITEQMARFSYSGDVYSVSTAVVPFSKETFSTIDIGINSRNPFTGMSTDPPDFLSMPSSEYV